MSQPGDPLASLRPRIGECSLAPLMSNVEPLWVPARKA